MKQIQYMFVHDDKQFPHSINNPCREWIRTMHYKNEEQINALRAMLPQCRFVSDQSRDTLIMSKAISWSRREQTNIYAPLYIIEQCNHTVITRFPQEFASEYREWRLTNKFVFDGVAFSHEKFTKIYVVPANLSTPFTEKWVALYDDDQENLICLVPDKSYLEWMLSHPYLKEAEIIHMDK